MQETREMRRRVIWKFQLTADVIPMPMDAEVCTFEFQHGIPCIWAIVDPDILSTPRKFKIVGTGHEIPGPDECCYVGTTQDGDFVWHLFELL